MLKHRNGAYRIEARRKPEDRRFRVLCGSGSDHALPHDIPAAHRPGAVAAHLRHAGIVGLAESRQLGLDELGIYPLSDRRAAVFLEGGWIKDCVGKSRIVLLAFDDPISYLRGSQLQALSWAGGDVVFAIAEEGTSGKDSRASSTVMYR